MKDLSFSPVEIPRGVWGAGPPSPEEEAKADDERKDLRVSAPFARRRRGTDCLSRLAWVTFRAYIAVMSGFIYFDITDHARLPARFFGMTRNVLARG